MFRRRRRTANPQKPKAPPQWDAAVDELGIVVVFGTLSAGATRVVRSAIGVPQVGRPLRLDLAGVTSIDADGVHLLDDLARDEDAQKRQMVLTAISDTVADCLGIVRRDVPEGYVRAEERWLPRDEEVEVESWRRRLA